MPKFHFNGQLLQTSTVEIEAPTLTDAIERAEAGSYDRVYDTQKPEGFTWEGNEVFNANDEEFTQVEIVFDAIRKFATECIGCQADRVTTASVLIDDLGADSLDHMDLFATVENHFGIDIPDADRDQLLTIGNLVDYVVTATATASTKAPVCLT